MSADRFWVCRYPHIIAGEYLEYYVFGTMYTLCKYRYLAVVQISMLEMVVWTESTLAECKALSIRPSIFFLQSIPQDSREQNSIKIKTEN